MSESIEISETRIKQFVSFLERSITISTNELPGLNSAEVTAALCRVAAFFSVTFDKREPLDGIAYGIEEFTYQISGLCKQRNIKLPSLDKLHEMVSETIH